MVAPDVDPELFHQQFVAAWAAETVAACLLQAAWCCAAVLLQARAVVEHKQRVTAFSFDTSLLNSKWKPSKFKYLSWSHVPGSFRSYQRIMCILQQQRPLPPLPKQLLLLQQELCDLEFSKADLLLHALVSTPKPQGPNCWAPVCTSQAGDTAGTGPATAPSETSTHGTGRSAAGGQSSSAASGSTSAQGSQHTSGQNSIGGGGGGQDDSDEDGNDKRRLAYQLAKSHSLETPDPLIAGTSTADIIQAAVDRARTLGIAAAAAEAPSERQPPAASTSAPAAAATGPWRLASPFATVAVSAPSSSAQPAPRRMKSPFAAQAAPSEQRRPQAATTSSSTSSSRRSTAPMSPFAAAQASTSASAQQQAAAATGPWKLASPFAAVSASPAASVSPVASTAQKPRSGAPFSKSGPPAAGSMRSLGGPMQQSISPARAYSPFAAAQQGGTSPFGSSSSSSDSSGRSGTRRAAAAAAAAYAASRASQGASSSMGSRGPAATGPWRLHSPFAAAPMPAFSATSTQLDAVAEEEPMDMEAARAAPASISSWSQLRPTQQSVDALVAAAAAARKQQQATVSGASPTPSAPSSGHSSYSKSRSPTPPAAQAGVSYSPRMSGASTPARPGSQQAAGSSAPMQPVGPGGIRSPFAAAAAVAAATDAAFTPGSTPRASPTGSATGSQHQNTGSPKQGSRKGSSTASSRARQVSSMAQSISLNTLMYPGAFGTSSVPSGSTEDRAITAGGSSGSVPTVGSKSRGASGSAQGSGSGGSLAAAAAAAQSSSGAAAAPGASAPSTDITPAVKQPELASVPVSTPAAQQQTAWRSPFAAVSAGPVPPAAAARPAGAMAGSWSARAATSSCPQHVTFRSAVMPIAVSAAQAALMPPVLMAMPPRAQRMTAAVDYQLVQAPAPLSLGAVVPAVAGAGVPAVLLPQYVLPSSAGMVSAAGLMSSTPGGGVIPVPVSGGMPGFLVHPSLALLQANRAQHSPAASIAAGPAGARRMPAQHPAAASPIAAAQARPPASPFADAQAAPVPATSAGSGSVRGVRPATAVSASSAGFAAEEAPKLGCMCVAPACLAEGILSQVQVYVLGLESRKAQPGPGHTYRVAAFMGSSLVAEATRECKGGERLLRISLPALPKGVVQILVLDDTSRPCFMQHVLVLPPPCAQDLNSLWADLLRGQIVVPVSAPASAAGASASAASAASGSIHSSFGKVATGPLCTSTESSKESCKCAATSSSSSTKLLQTGSVATSGSLAHRKLGPYEIQGLWDHSFSRVTTQIAAVLLTRSRSPELPTGVRPVSTAECAAALGAPGQAGLFPRTSFDTAEMKDRVSTLLHLLATHSKWAVLELLTAHVYGYGASARAMFASHVQPSAGFAEAAAGAISFPAEAATGTLSVTAAADAPAGPSAATAAVAGSRVQQAAVPAQAQSEIQPVEPGAPLSSGSNSFSFQGVFSAAQHRSRSLAPASSGAATGQSGSDAAAGGSAAGSYQGRGSGERRVLKALRIGFKRAFSSKQ